MSTTCGDAVFHHKCEQRKQRHIYYRPKEEDTGICPGTRLISDEGHSTGNKELFSNSTGAFTLKELIGGLKKSGHWDV